MGNSGPLSEASEHDPDGVGSDGLAMLGEEQLAGLVTSDLQVSLHHIECCVAHPDVRPSLETFSIFTAGFWSVLPRCPTLAEGEA